MKLTDQESYDLKRLRQSLNEATFRVGEIDMQIAQLDGMKQQARIETARLANEFQQAAQRASQAHGVNPQTHVLDIETGEFRSKIAGLPSLAPSPPSAKPNGKKQPRATP